METTLEDRSIPSFPVTIHAGGQKHATLTVRCLGGNTRDEFGKQTAIDPNDIPFNLVYLRPQTYAVDIAVGQQWVRLSIEVALAPQTSK